MAGAIKSKFRRMRPGQIVVAVLAVIWAFVAVFPFFFMFLSSIKKNSELFLNGVFALPEQFYVGNYQEVFEGDFFLYFRNSTLTLALAIAGILVISTLASYVFARLTNRVTAKLLSVVVACMSIPIHVACIPLFILTQNMNTYDTIIGLAGPYIAFYLPISIFILTGFMRGIPSEIEEAALIDGCSFYQIFLKIILPLSKPGIATIVIYDSVYIWNEFSFALILTSTMRSKTLPLAISDFKGEYTMNVPLIMAVLTLCAIPMIIAFCIGQDKLVKGMMAGAVKG